MTKVRVIIPLCGTEIYLSEAIQSVLSQTFTNFELIVINNKHSDEVVQIINEFSDPRLAYCENEQKGLTAVALDRGLGSSSVETVAFLEPDDRFKPEFLATHLAFLERHPEIGASYSSYFELDSQGNSLTLQSVPPTMGLADILLSSSLTLSNTVIRKSWFDQCTLEGNKNGSKSKTLSIFSQLALLGCQFSGISQSLSYSRRNPDRPWLDLERDLEEILNIIEDALSDSRCPTGVLFRNDKVIGNIYLRYAYEAFIYDQTNLGQTLFRKSIQKDRSILDVQGQRCLEFFVQSTIREGDEHEARLRNIFEQLPSEFAWLTPHIDWAVARGYLYRGIRAILWGQSDMSCSLFQKASASREQFDNIFWHDLAGQLADHETQFGTETTREVVIDLTEQLSHIGSRATVRWFTGSHFVNQAHKAYQASAYRAVPPNVIRAVSSNPAFLFNRGLLTILIRSLMRRIALT